MKKLVALLCVLVLMLTVLAACGEKSSDEEPKNETSSVSSNTFSEKENDEETVISIEKIKKAFEDAGHTAGLGDAEFWKEEVENEENVDEIKTCSAMILSEDKKNVMDITFYQYVCDSKENAVKRFDEHLEHQKTSNNVEFTKSEVNGYLKAYGKIETSTFPKKIVTIIWQKDNVHMYVLIDWSDFDKAGLGYDDSAEKIIEKLGL